MIYTTHVAHVSLTYIKIILIHIKIIFNIVLCIFLFADEIFYVRN